jgi:heme exporter protein D
LVRVRRLVRVRDVFIVWYAFVVWYAFGRVFAIIGLRTSSGLKSRRLVKRVILRNRRKNL